MKNAWLVLHVVAVIIRASLSTCSAKTQCHFDRQAGCFDSLSNLHYEPGQHDETTCAFKCREHSIATIRNGDCFCARSDHRDLLVKSSDKCSDRAFTITCNSEGNKQHHNLCPDYTRSYCNSSYSIDDRIESLLSYMTLQDKIDTMAQKSVAGNNTDGTPLVARSYRWWNEALHGVEPHHDPPNMTCGHVCPTQFAEANSLSQSWNRSLWRRTASVISTQVRAHYNEHVMEGLTLYVPQINLASNPLWGRNMETPVEDPYLTSIYAIDFIVGLQGNKKTLKTIATPKHFVGHFFEGEGSDPWGNGTQVTRYQNDTSYSLQDLQQYYLPPFRAALRHAGSVMCAYQSVNGVPMCGNGFLLNRVLRDEWKWHGFVVSDCDAIDSMRLGFHGYSLTGEMAVRDGIRAGCDSNCGSVYSDFGKSALEMDLVAQAQVNTSVKRLIRALLRLGLFDPPEEDQYGHLGWQHVNTDKQKALSLEGARQSIVLLQNGANVLPLPRNQSILVAGPMYSATVDLMGNYFGPACDGGGGGCLMSPSQWIAKLNGHHGAISSLGGIPKGCSEDERAIPWVLRQAELVDVIILALGGTCREREGDDRGFLHLPGSQLALFKAVAEIGKPIVVFIVGGGTYSIDELKANDKIAILQAGFPGPYGGRAIAETIFGDVNPSGKLTSTIYPSSYATLRPMTGTPWMDSRIRPNDEGEGRSHMFYTGTPLFSFGFGLSYTTFALSWPREPPLPLFIDLDHVDTQLPKVKFEVQLTNTGTLSGKEIVQAYWSPPSEVDSQLKRQLFAFEGATLNPGMSTILHFALPTDASTIASVNESGDQVFHPGTYTITLTRGHGKSLQIQVVIHGINVRHLSSFPSAWVEGHAVTVEACVEGTSDVVPHTEQFLLAYKQWQWVTTVQQDQGWIQHTASGMCLQQHVIGHLQNVSLQKCVENKQSQLWTHLGARISPVETDRLCLTTVASDSSQLRTDVHLSIDCTSPSSGWILLPDGLLRSNVPSLPDRHLDAEEGLCLAARSEGRYNNGA